MFGYLTRPPPARGAETLGLETHPLELLPPLLLAEGVGGVHDLPTLGRLHLSALPLALRRRSERAAAAAVASGDLAERREGEGGRRVERRRDGFESM